MEVDIKSLTMLAVRAAKAAGERIMEVYAAADFGVEWKDDLSPLTKADTAAHQVIDRLLKDSHLPILSEEGAEIPYEERRYWDYFWMVDPLDGTKEFIKKSGEFTVNIALIHQGYPVLGVVYAPDLEWMYWGNSLEGAFKQIRDEPPVKLVLPDNLPVETLAVSLSHHNQATANFIKKFPDASVISMGSSLKFMLLAENKAQVYPRFGPTMEWDTAAAHGILCAVGGRIVHVETGKSLTYNKKILYNPNFVASIGADC